MTLPRHRRSIHLWQKQKRFFCVGRAPSLYPPFTKQEYNRHFRNFSRSKEDVTPLFNIPVRLLGAFAQVRTVPCRKLKATLDGQYTSVVVPRLDTHIILVGEA